jgi:signal transduction histidine kinase
MQNSPEKRITQSLGYGEGQEEQIQSQEELQKRVIQLEQQAADLEQERHLLTERTRLVELSSEISDALISKLKQLELLQRCCEAMVHHLEIGLACIWKWKGADLQFQTGFGDMSYVEEPGRLAELESLLIEKVIKTQRPYIASSRSSERGQIHLPDPQAFTAFASYPLIVEEKMLGVLGLFAPQPLTYSTFQALIASANAIALGMAHRNMDQQREALLILAQEAQQHAEEALTLRNAFLSSVTHDLKSPLTSIIGSSQMLQRLIEKYQPPESEKYQQALSVISKSTKHMAIMIEDLLDLAKLQMGQKLELNREEGDLVEVVQRIAIEHQLNTEKHHITLQTSQLALPAFFDPARIERVLTNLLSNAIKYSPKGGEIQFSITRQESTEGEEAVFILKDQGIGIPEKDLPHIFEPFHRASNSERRIQGTGIGLTSAAQIIEHHGGSISVISVEGEGTTFIVRLPLLTSQ